MYPFWAKIGEKKIPYLLSVNNRNQYYSSPFHLRNFLFLFCCAFLLFALV